MADNPIQHPTDKSQLYTGTLGRSQREDKLRHFLALGAETIPDQMRYILALSQMMNAPSIDTSHHIPSQSVLKARLTALTHLTQALDGKQVESLLAEAHEIEDDAVRIPVVVHLALQSEADDYRNIIKDVWTQIQHLSNPLTRTRTYLQLAPLISLMDDEPGTPRNLLDVVAFAQSIRQTEARVRSLVALAPHLPLAMSTRLLKRALDDLKETPNDTLRANTIIAMANFLPRDLENQAYESTLAIKTPIDRARALTALVRTIPDDAHNHLRHATLETIIAIGSEDDRADIFNKFVPFIGYAREEEDFPELIEKALRIAVGMSRVHIRARALVSLAPHVTLDLQGEALAAVHSLDNERDRATLLADLAPHLPPDMLVASLAVAHTMREQDARVYALTALAHYVPEYAQAQTILDALAAAINLPHYLERITALMALVGVLPPAHKNQAFLNALDTIELLDNPNARARALSLVGGHLPPELIRRASELAYDIDSPEQQLQAFAGIIKQLKGNAHEQTLRGMLACAQNMPVAYKQTRALVSIAPHLTFELIDVALEIADTLDDPFDRASAYIALAQNMPPDSQTYLINEAWRLIQNIEDGYDRASALSAIALLMPDDKKDALADVANQVIGAIMDEYDQASAISILAPLLVGGDSPDATSDIPTYYEAVKQAVLSALDIPEQGWRVDLFSACIDLWMQLNPGASYALWEAVAWQMTTLPLADTLLCLGAVTPIIRNLCGDNRLKEIAQLLGMR